MGKPRALSLDSLLIPTIDSVIGKYRALSLDSLLIPTIDSAIGYLLCVDNCSCS